MTDAMNAGIDAAAPLTESELFPDVALKPDLKVTLADRFTVPPFSYLDARAGWWKDRKQQWVDLGLTSGDGRDVKSFAKGGKKAEAFMEALAAQPDKTPVSIEAAADVAGIDHVSAYVLASGGASGTSIFDPVLCELLYRWFCPIGGSVLDPTAGGSVRGLVAATLGRTYHGIDLSAPQVQANIDQAWDWVGRNYHPDVNPTWYVGDADEILNGLVDDPLPQGVFDFILTCPPYFDLEVYSNHPCDLSAMPWQDFLGAYYSIIAAACARLADDRFAAFVIGEVRDRDGIYRNLVGHTVDAFTAAGLGYYNELHLVSPVGTLPMRTARQFVVSRKVGRTHQSVLVFVKGDPKKAAAAMDPDVMRALLGDAEADALEAELGDFGHG